MTIEADQNRSFWEEDVWPLEVDVLIVGGGIVGLHAALHLQNQRPDYKIMVVEAGWNQQGASTKNAGFVCLGSPSELLEDIRLRGEEECLRTLQMRFRGTEYLRQQAQKSDLDFKDEPGYELFEKEDSDLFDLCCEKLTYLNEIFLEATGLSNQFSPVQKLYDITGASGIIQCQYEGNIHPGKWIKNLLSEAMRLGVNVLRGVRYLSHENEADELVCTLSVGRVRCKRIVFATNGYRDFDPGEVDLTRVKNQVYLTDDWSGALPGTYHASRGFIYFRKIGQKLLIGGARHLDAHAENDMYNHEIESYLMNYLNQHLPSTKGLTFIQKWTGFLGIGESKYPVVKKLRDREYVAVRLGGMGVAIGAEVGKQAAELCLEDE